MPPPLQVVRRSDGSFSSLSVDAASRRAVAAARRALLVLIHHTILQVMIPLPTHPHSSACFHPSSLMRRHVLIPPPSLPPLQGSVLLGVSMHHILRAFVVERAQAQSGGLTPPLGASTPSP